MTLADERPMVASGRQWSSMVVYGRQKHVSGRQKSASGRHRSPVKITLFSANFFLFIDLQFKI
jgi:hypothetical protein